jgi:ABC-type transporter Mla maintaining outer membrane lipid asymmetry ATPase subunit MlaF
MLEAHNKNTPIRVSHDLLHSDISQTLTEVLVWNTKDALDLVSVGFTHNTSTSGSAAANVLLVLNDKKIKEHAKLNGKLSCEKKWPMIQAAMVQVLRP